MCINFSLFSFTFLKTKIQLHFTLQYVGLILAADSALGKNNVVFKPIIFLQKLLVVFLNVSSEITDLIQLYQKPNQCNMNKLRAAVVLPIFQTTISANPQRVQSSYQSYLEKVRKANDGIKASPKLRVVFEKVLVSFSFP